MLLTCNKRGQTKARFQETIFVEQSFTVHMILVTLGNSKAVLVSPLKLHVDFFNSPKRNLLGVITQLNFNYLGLQNKQTNTLVLF